MFRRTAVIATLLAFVGVVSSCSSDASDGDSAGDGSDTTTLIDDSPAPIDSADPGGGDGGTVDCVAMEAAFGALIVNSQIVVQLANQPDITEWSTIIGTMPEFAGQLETLRALEQFGADVKDAIDFFAGANEIAQRGYAGDAAAAGELATFVGPDVAAALGKRTPIAVAYDATDC